MRYKIPADVAICVKCFDAHLSTNGYRVVCRCGDETVPAQWGKALRRFAARVKRENSGVARSC